MKIELIKIQAILICLVPIALITGPFLSDLIVSVLGIFFIFQSIHKRLFHYYYHPIAIILFFFNIYIIVRSLFSEFPILSLESSLFYFRFTIFSLCVWHVLNNYPKLKLYFLYSLIICFLLLIADSYFQYFTGNNILGYPYSKTNLGSSEARLSSFFGEEKILGSYLSRLFPLFFALMALKFSNSKPMIIFSMILFILVDILIIFSSERAAIFYLLFSSLIIILLIEKWKIYRIATLIISLILFTVIIISNQSVKYRVVEKTINQLNIFGDNLHVFSIQHQVIYKSSLMMFRDNPIFGIGPKNFRKTCKKSKYEVLTDKDHSINGCQAHPHNTYIQLLSETGLVGFIPIFFLLLNVLMIFFSHFYSVLFKRKYILTDYQVCLLTAMLITLWPFVPTGNAFNNWLGVLYFLPLGFFLNTLKKNYN
tara:strand:- start:5817 stop:7088 length:1272 start_codon:yes stop_codon:yes gene_type:complete